MLQYIPLDPYNSIRFLILPSEPMMTLSRDPTPEAYNREYAKPLTRGGRFGIMVASTP